MPARHRSEEQWCDSHDTDHFDSRRPIAGTHFFNNLSIRRLKLCLRGVRNEFDAIEAKRTLIGTSRSNQPSPVARQDRREILADKRGPIAANLRPGRGGPWRAPS